MNIIKDRDFREFVARQESQSVRPAADFIDEAMDRLANGVSCHGDPLPWTKTHESFRFREGEISIWAGVNGGGKSLVMGQTAIWLAKETKVLIASMEMLGAATVARMLRQGSGVSEPSPMFVEKFRDYTKDNLWIYDQIGTVDPNNIIGMIHWGATELGIKHFMIDSLVKCGVDQSKNEPQKHFVDALCWAAKEHKVHVHLVVHVRKQSDERSIPDRFAIKGAGEITDLADNVLICSRNGAKEADKRAERAVDDEDPDCFIRVAKQRHGEWDGVYGFWWHEQSQQWVPKPNAGAMPYPDHDRFYGIRGVA